ncbi:MAG: hypothetical protein Q9227_007877 [Pyrenula ochraceoflavens]
MDQPELPKHFPCWCRAVYSWGGETKKDLGFVEGDIIECLNAGDGSWWMGRLKRDRRMVGLFPSNFVVVLDEDPESTDRSKGSLDRIRTLSSGENGGADSFDGKKKHRKSFLARLFPTNPFVSPPRNEDEDSDVPVSTGGGKDLSESLPKTSRASLLTSTSAKSENQAKKTTRDKNTLSDPDAKGLWVDNVLRQLDQQIETRERSGKTESVRSSLDEKPAARSEGSEEGKQAGRSPANQGTARPLDHDATRSSEEGGDLEQSDNGSAQSEPIDKLNRGSLVDTGNLRKTAYEFGREYLNIRNLKQRGPSSVITTSSGQTSTTNESIFSWLSSASSGAYSATSAGSLARERIEFKDARPSSRSPPRPRIKFPDTSLFVPLFSETQAKREFERQYSQWDWLYDEPKITSDFFMEGLSQDDFYIKRVTRPQALDTCTIVANVPDSIEIVAELTSLGHAIDAKHSPTDTRTLSQLIWYQTTNDYRQRCYIIDAALPNGVENGKLNIYAGKKGLTVSRKDIVLPLAMTVFIHNWSERQNLEFVKRHPTPHARRYDIYIQEPQCFDLLKRSIQRFRVLQSPALSVDEDFNAWQKPAKLAVQTPSGKIIRLLPSSSSDVFSEIQNLSNLDGKALGSSYEALLEVQELGTWRGLVLADRQPRWCVWAEWECVEFRNRSNDTSSQLEVASSPIDRPPPESIQTSSSIYRPSSSSRTSGRPLSFHAGVATPFRTTKTFGPWVYNHMPPFSGPTPAPLSSLRTSVTAHHKPLPAVPGEGGSVSGEDLSATHEQQGLLLDGEKEIAKASAERKTVEHERATEVRRRLEYSNDISKSAHSKPSLPLTRILNVIPEKDRHSDDFDLTNRSRETNDSIASLRRDTAAGSIVRAPIKEYGAELEAFASSQMRQILGQEDAYRGEKELPEAFDDNPDRSDEEIADAPSQGDPFFGNETGRRSDAGSSDSAGKNVVRNQHQNFSEQGTSSTDQSRPDPQILRRRRRAQNRAAQRAFRERKENHLKDLETKVEDLARSSKAVNHENSILKAQMEKLQVELREYRKHSNNPESAEGSIERGIDPRFRHLADELTIEKDSTDLSNEIPPEPHIHSSNDHIQNSLSDGRTRNLAPQAEDPQPQYLVSQAPGVQAEDASSNVVPHLLSFTSLSELALRADNTVDRDRSISQSKALPESTLLDQVTLKEFISETKVSMPNERRRYLATRRDAMLKSFRNICDHLRANLTQLALSGEQNKTTITWTCACGRTMYARIRELKPGAALKLQQALRQSSAKCRNNLLHSAAGAANSPPPSNNLATTSSSEYGQGVPSQTPNTQPSEAPSDPGHIAISPSPSGTSSSSGSVPHRQFLLTCFDSTVKSELVQIDLTSISNDEYMFNLIRNEYTSLDRQRKSPKLLACQNWIRKHAPLLATFIIWLFHVKLVKAAGLDFVRFRLVPLKQATQPWNFVSPSLPPEEEVKRQNYLYIPCPQDEYEITGLTDAMLHSLLEPGPHLDSFWLNLFPKKLKVPLSYVPSHGGAIINNMAWGIRIRRGLNWAAVLWLLVLTVTISGVAAIIYSAVARDPSGAFTMAGYAVTVVAVGIGYRQWKSMAPG